MGIWEIFDGTLGGFPCVFWEVFDGFLVGVQEVFGSLVGHPMKLGTDRGMRLGPG